jgi:hypothetical protein
MEAHRRLSEEVSSMCHEGWWRERRARREEESRAIWLDFEQTPPADEPDVPRERPDVTRLERESDELVPSHD